MDLYHPIHQKLISLAIVIMECIVTPNNDHTNVIFLLDYIVLVVYKFCWNRKT